MFSNHMENLQSYFPGAWPHDTMIPATETSLIFVKFFNEPPPENLAKRASLANLNQYYQLTSTEGIRQLVCPSIVL